MPRLTGGGLDAEVRFVRFTDDRGEPFIDPRGYLDRLPELAGALPPGARAFATDPAHYDFSGGRCVKDLTLRHQVSDPEEDLFELRFAHNCWKHEEDLTIRYRGLRRVHADVEVTDLPGKFAVVLDEILPHPDGCRHEIAFRGGTMVVVARDLTAVWNEADCPDKPGRRGEGR